MIVRRLLVATAVATLAAGCSSDDNGQEPRATDGPLVSLVGGGGNSLHAPRRRHRWTGTFGSLLVCAEDGADVEIRSVSYSFVVKPVAVRALIRKVPALPQRTGRAEAWAPMIALRGTVAELKDDEMVSTSLEAPRGVMVDTPCDKDEPGDAFTELITSMTADERGGWIDAATIAYSSGGDDYEVTIPWTYITCGTAIRTQRVEPAPCARQPGRSSSTSAAGSP